MIEHGRTAGGLGAIFPAMANYVMSLRTLGYCNDSYLVAHGIREMDQLRSRKATRCGLQPCFSPVWDTAISSTRLHESGLPSRSLRPASGDTLAAGQGSPPPGDWRVKHSESHRYTEPNKPVGGWFFEYDNEFYPDVDDTIMVLMALNRVSTRVRPRKIGGDSSRHPLGARHARQRRRLGAVSTRTTTSGCLRKCRLPTITR